MAPVTEIKPPFPWESPDYATGPFWDGIDNEYHNMSRQAQKVFGAEKLATLNLDASQDKKGKLNQLLAVTKEHIATTVPFNAADPVSLPHDEWELWYQGNYLYGALLDDLELYAESEPHWRAEIATWEKRIAAGTDPEMRADVDLGAIGNLSRALMGAGKLAEAEENQRAYVPVIRGYKRLGPNSPQALGALRTLVEILAKEGKQDEAFAVADETRGVIAELAKGQFAKYEKEEIEELDRVKGEIPTWSAAAVKA